MHYAATAAAAVGGGGAAAVDCADHSFVLPSTIRQLVAADALADQRSFDFGVESLSLNQGLG